MGSMKRLGIIASALFVATWAYAAGITTPLMSLKLPTPGPGGTTGPQWASMLNTALQSIDSHNHTTGRGAKVPSAGILIDSDLSFGGYNAASIKSARFSPHASALVGANDKNSVYAVNGDLYFNNGSGSAVQITSGSGINAASIGGIGGDYATSAAAVSYSNTTKTFTFAQSSGVPAKMSFGDMTLFEPAAGTQGITVKSPPSLATSYNLTLPGALPASGTKILTVTSLGQVENAYDMDGSTLEVSSNALRIKDAGVTTAKIADANVTSTKIASGAVTQAKRAALDVQITSSSGSFNVASTSAVAPDLVFTLPITTTGRPVALQLIPDGSGSSSGLTVSAAANGFMTILIYRDGVEIYSGVFGMNAGAAFTLTVPPSFVAHTDIGAVAAGAGAKVYTLKAYRSSSSLSAQMARSKLLAYEL